MSQLAEKLKTLMRRHNITETELSRITDIGQPVIHRMASGNTENPKVLTLLPIAQHFGLTIFDLMNDHPLPTPQFEEQKKELYEIPFITFQDVKRWLETTTNESSESVTIDRFVSEHAFATKINDSSMRPTMPEGTIAIIDPNHCPQNLEGIAF